ncbi:MAG: type 1 glutamine amidotransferase [Planctomycetota bacterium]|nr:MAG: type 1 glutamine amidotransferase [Planctomycetota bacterium]
MATIVVLQHSKHGGPGRIGMTLRDHGFRLDIRRVDLAPDAGGRAVPPDLDNVHGVLALGGPQNVDESHPWLDPEREFLARAHAAGLPVVGICLGAQLIAQALGGSVGPMDTPEAGFAPVDLLTPAQTDPLFSGIAWRSWQFHSHAYEVKELPPGAQLLASSQRCKVQAFKCGMRTLGIQYHPEYDRAMIESSHTNAQALFAGANVTIDELSRQADKYYPSFARLGDRLALNLATLCFPSRTLLAV